MRILALDPGSVTGYAFFHHGKLAGFGHYDLKSPDDPYQFIYDRIRSHMPLDFVAYEAYWGIKRYVATTEMNPLELIGVIKLGATHSQAKWYMVFPQQVKKFMTGNAKATKTDIMKALLQTNIILDGVLNDHEADAIAIGLTFLDEYAKRGEEMFE